MDTPAAQLIGRTLVRLGRATERRAEVGDAPPAGSSREAILELLRAAPSALTIEQLTADCGLHANTVRGHLDVLRASGKVERILGPRGSRGRPPWLYRTVSGASDPQVRLAGALLDQLAGADDEALTVAAAARWADALEPTGFGQHPVATPDEAVDRAADSLRQLGFRAQVDPVGDRIDLRGCPYAALVAERPVICEIHAALLQDILAKTGQPVGLDHLDVWSRPGHCTAHLSRDDLVPARSITPVTPGQPARKGA